MWQEDVAAAKSWICQAGARKHLLISIFFLVNIIFQSGNEELPKELEQYCFSTIFSSPSLLSQRCWGKSSDFLTPCALSDSLQECWSVYTAVSSQQQWGIHAPSYAFWCGQSEHLFSGRVNVGPLFMASQNPLSALAQRACGTPLSCRVLNQCSAGFHWTHHWALNGSLWFSPILACLLLWPAGPHLSSSTRVKSSAWLCCKFTGSVDMLAPATNTCLSYALLVQLVNCLHAAVPSGAANGGVLNSFNQTGCWNARWFLKKQLKSNLFSWNVLSEFSLVDGSGLLHLGPQVLVSALG